MSYQHLIGAIGPIPHQHRSGTRGDNGVRPSLT
jgi:hypothetical protein